MLPAHSYFIKFLSKGVITIVEALLDVESHTNITNSAGPSTLNV